MNDPVDALVKIVQLVELPVEVDYRKVRYHSYNVMIGALVLGTVEQGDETLERRTKGKVYVNARWTRVAWRWKRMDLRHGSSIGFFESRKRALRDLIGYMVRHALLDPATISREGTR